MGEVVERSFFLGNLLAFGSALRRPGFLEILDEKPEGMGTGFDEVNGVEVLELFARAVESLDSEDSILNQVHHGEEVVDDFGGVLVQNQKGVLFGAVFHAMGTFVQEFDEEVLQVGPDVQVEFFLLNHYFLAEK